MKFGSSNNVDVAADNHAACECADEAWGGRAATDTADPGCEPRQQCERGRQILLAALAATLPAGTGNSILASSHRTLFVTIH